MKKATDDISNWRLQQENISKTVSVCVSADATPVLTVLWLYQGLVSDGVELRLDG